MFLLLTTLAWADAIPPNPTCPTGARGVSSHAGDWCELEDAEACLCVVEDTVRCGGRRPQSAEPCLVERKKVVGTCGVGGACDSGICANAAACPSEPPLAPPETPETPEIPDAPATDGAPDAPDAPQAPSPPDATPDAPAPAEPPTAPAAPPTSEDGCAHVPLASGALGLALIGLAGVSRRRD